MALSTLRIASRLRPLLCQRSLVVSRSAPMAQTAREQMQEYWDKNQRLQRPNSPWVIYWPHVPMLTSLTHRTTGIIMGVSLYGIGAALFFSPGDFTSYIQMVQGWELNPAVLFMAKSTVAFPLIYHYINGIRHLSWDWGMGYELSTQYKTGLSIVATAVSLALLAGGAKYLM